MRTSIRRLRNTPRFAVHMALFLAISALLVGCGSEPPSEQLVALRSDPIAQLEIASGTEFRRTETDNGDFKRTDGSASIRISFRPDADNSSQDVLDELIDVARENDWPVTLGEEFNRASKTLDGFEAELSISIFEDGSGVFVLLSHPDDRAA